MTESTRPQTSNAPQGFGGSTQRAAYPDLTAGEAAIHYFKEYARERPEIVTMWAFGLGFIFGWKLRIW